MTAADGWHRLAPVSPIVRAGRAAIAIAVLLVPTALGGGGDPRKDLPQLVVVGVPGRRASRVALAVVAGMEGALILCRAEGTSAPLEIVAAELKHLLPSEVKT